LVKNYAIFDIFEFAAIFYYDIVREAEGTDLGSCRCIYTHTVSYSTKSAFLVVIQSVTCLTDFTTY